MSLGKIGRAFRGTFRWHGWLLLAWALLVGLAANSVQTQLLHVKAFALRYAVNAAAVYFLGFICGGWWYAHWWAQRKEAAAADLPQRATPQEELEYDQAQKQRSRSTGWASDLLDLISLGDDPLSALLGLIGLMALLVVVVIWLPSVPIFITEALGGYLAELVLEFVVGAALARRALRPRPLGEFWLFALGRTLLPGLLMIAVFAMLGFVRQMAQT